MTRLLKTDTGNEAESEAESDIDAGAGLEPERKTGAEPETGTETGTGAEEADGARRPSAARRKAVVAVLVTALLLAGGGFFYGAHQLRSTPSARNHALTDTAATTRVGGDVGEGLARIFSYTPTGSDAAERAAGTVLGGRAARQYADLFAQVRASLVEQRITLSTQAVRTGVIELDGDRAVLLVFLDQVSRRGKGAATSVAAQLTVTAQFQGDRWLIVDIKAR
ncbi:Mce-associated membrane protein [Streptomyces filamentosus]